MDFFIDDLIQVAFDINNNAHRTRHAVPLTIHTVGRPLSQLELIKRDAMLSLSKLQGEGRLEEMKVVTG